jgi:hypothetical protein
MKYDRVWWWSGGTERGVWRDTPVEQGETAHDLVKRLRQQGYVAVPGSSSIGAPEGPPRPEAFAALPGLDRYGRVKGQA